MQHICQSVGWQDPVVFARIISRLENQINELGFLMEYGADFAALESCLVKTDKEALTEHFATALNTYTPETAFWIRAATPTGETVACGAIRLDRLGSQTLDAYLRNYWHRCYPDALGDGVRASQRQPQFMKEISGDVAYLGDLWVAREHQRRKIHEYFSPLAMLITVQRWDPDWMYCWVRPNAWSKRYPLAYGFTSVHPIGIRWDTAPATIDTDLVMATSTRVHAMDWVEKFANEYPVALHTSSAAPGQTEGSNGQ